MVGLNRLRRCLVCAIICGACQTFAFAASASDEKPGQVVTAYTAPAEQHRLKLNFRQQGIVSKVMIKEGDKVTAGQVLVQLDDTVERHQWESLDLQGRSDAQVEAAKTEASEKDVVLKRMETSHATAAASDTELDEARLAADLAKKKIIVAEEDKQAKSFEALAKKSVMDQMKIASPIDGEVEKVDIGTGELVDPQRPAVIVVNNETLRVVMDLPNGVADKLTLGEPLDVRYNESEAWQKAAVEFISPSADASSFTRRVTLTLVNTANMASGHEIKVKLPERAVVAENSLNVR